MRVNVVLTVSTEIHAVETHLHDAINISLVRQRLEGPRSR